MNTIVFTVLQTMMSTVTSITAVNLAISLFALHLFVQMSNNIFIESKTHKHICSDVFNEIFTSCLL